ncbi:hypothetical protein As57867_006421, partial [Aphanomyces stellatus]
MLDMLVAYCTPHVASSVAARVAALVEPFRTDMAARTTEQTYCAGTRAILGTGFLVHELLFDDEFVTVYVRNLPATLDPPGIRAFVAKVLKIPPGTNVLRSIDQQVSSGGDQTVALTFYDKRVARQVFSGLQGELVAGKNVQVSVGKAAEKPGLQQSTTAQIRVSWATEQSTGIVNILFASARQANQFIRSYHSILPEATKVQPLGANPKHENNKGPPRPPTVSAGPNLFIFQEDTTKFTSFTVAVHGLASDVDETHLTTRLAAVPYQRFFLKRVAPP